MNIILKLRGVGPNSIGATFPKEFVERHNLHEGDNLVIKDFELVSGDTEFECKSCGCNFMDNENNVTIVCPACAEEKNVIQKGDY